MLAQGVLQGSILGVLLFLNYINVLSNGVSSNCKLFAGNTSLFSVVNDIQSTAATLRNDLTLISNWVFHWKMTFNSDWTKQAQEVIFGRKTKKLLTLVFQLIKFLQRIVYLKNISG